MKLQLYVLRQLLVSLAFSTGGILFVALPGLAVGAVHRMPGADAFVLLRYIPLALQTLTPFVLPICFLLAVVVTYGRLAADREWTAIQMAGIQPWKLLLPSLGVAAVLGAGTYWMLANQLPLLKTKQRALLIDASTSILSNLRPGHTSVRLGEFQLDAQWMDPDTDLLHEVFIRRPGTEDDGTSGDRIDYHAKTAKIEIREDVLYATLTEFFQFRAGREVAQAYSDEIQIRLPLSELTDRGTSTRPRFLTTAQLIYLLESGEAPERRVLAYHYEIQYRRALAAIYLVFLGLGAPTGLILRKGTQLGALAISSGYALLYYILNMRVAKDLAISGIVDPRLAAWLPLVAGFGIGILLLRRAMRR